jgi:hypothetical protein
VRPQGNGPTRTGAARGWELPKDCCSSSLCQCSINSCLRRAAAGCRPGDWANVLLPPATATGTLWLLAVPSIASDTEQRYARCGSRGWAAGVGTTVPLRWASPLTAHLCCCFPRPTAVWKHLYRNRTSAQAARAFVSCALTVAAGLLDRKNRFFAANTHAIPAHSMQKCCYRRKHSIEASQGLQIELYTELAQDQSPPPEHFCLHRDL